MALEPMELEFVAPRVEYCCPMHPEVIQSEPGSCPKCGMALEARTAAAVETPNPELEDMERRFKVGVALTVPLLILAMTHMIPGESCFRDFRAHTELGPVVDGDTCGRMVRVAFL